MESALVIIVSSLTIIWVLLIMSYVRVLTFIATYSYEHGLKISERSYLNIFHLMADITFLNELWSGKSVEIVQDTVLKNGLLRARKLLKVNMAIGIALFLIPILNAVVKA
jgi:hypothetical protein